SRDEGVTIFLSTHFMNEAERCDRISLMHAGKVLAVGAPMDLVKERGSDSLEDTFVGYLADAAGIDRTKKVEAPPPDATHRRSLHWRSLCSSLSRCALPSRRWPSWPSAASVIPSLPTRRGIKRLITAWLRGLTITAFRSPVFWPRISMSNGCYERRSA